MKFNWVLWFSYRQCTEWTIWKFIGQVLKGVGLLLCHIHASRGQHIRKKSRTFRQSISLCRHVLYLTCTWICQGHKKFNYFYHCSPHGRITAAFPMWLIFLCSSFQPLFCSFADWWMKEELVAKVQKACWRQLKLTNIEAMSVNIICLQSSARWLRIFIILF
jgi:hypothetical protein